MITGAIYFTGAFSLLALGIYWKRASKAGAFLSLASGLTAVVGLKPIQAGLGIEMPSPILGIGV